MERALGDDGKTKEDLQLFHETEREKDKRFMDFSVGPKLKIS